jgi:hypothetical protein
MEGLIGFIAFFAMVFGIAYIHYTTRNKERMALIEKGAEASLFNTGKTGPMFNFNWSKFTLKIGMLSMGIALGVIVGALNETSNYMPQEPGYASAVFFFGGLSLVLFYLIDRKSK